MKGITKKYIKIIFFLLAAVAILIFFGNSIRYYINAYYNPSFIKKWILSFGKAGFLAFIFLQMLQVIVFFIPGEIVQIAGGFVYGAALGTILSILGILLGSVVTFLAARKYGDRFLKRILPQKNYTKIKNLIDKPGNRLIIFLLFLLPGFPKDILGYVSGITPIRLGTFMIVSTIARIPGIMMSTYVGSNLYSKNYMMVLIIIVIIAVFLILGLLRGEKIIDRLK